MSDADLLPPPPPLPSSSASFDAVGTTGSVNGLKENVPPKSSPTLSPSGDSQPAAAPAPVDPDHADSERDGGSTKADSEAETIIQSGRESISPEKRRKHIQHAFPATARTGQAHQADSDALDGDLFPPSKKRKRLDHDDSGDGQAAVSAIKARSRTSSISSVVKKEDGGKVDEDRSKDNQDSIRLLSDAPRRRNAGSRSPKLSLSENSLEGELTGDDSVDHQKQRRRRGSSNDRDRREKSHPQTNTSSTSTMKHRSVSPSYHSRKRASSGPQQASSERTQHKRKTAARSTRSPRRQSSEDHHSDSSSASVSPVRSARSRRLTSEGARVSSAKPATHKKQRDQNGRTRLARACAAQEYEAAMARHAERPEDLNVPDNAGNTPLQIASLEGCAPIVKFLLDAGCEIDTKNIDKDTPLIDAVENGHLEVVKLLLDAGANPRLGNAEGDEPYDLVPSDTEDYDEIRKIISHAKAHPARKRRSEDHGFSNSNKGSVPRGTSGTSPRDSPPAHMMSPPPGSSTFSRRKTVRSEATRNDLLWTKATPENLCNFAAKGDMAGVANILNVIQKADTESLIAAAKGGHEDVMSLLLGMGDGDADPEPVENSNCRPGFNTPMLAAIGRGNLAIIRLLLEYPGFNPARRLYKGLTYHEIAEERKGDRWEEEMELLKRAYDKHREMKKAKKAEAKSPKRVREQEKNLKKRSRRSASPSSVPRKPASSPASARTADVTSKENSKRRDSTSHKKDSSIANQRHNAVTQDDALSEHSVDQDTAKPKKMSSERRQSDASLHSRGDDAPKRRRLIAGRPPDRDRRRLSLMSTDSVSPREELSKSHSRVLKDLKDTKDALDVPAKLKRPRNSVSPERSRSRGSDRGRDSEDMSHKKKRRLQQEESARKMTNGTLKRSDDASSAEANKAASKVDKDAISEKRAARTNEVMAPVKQELKQQDTHQLDRIPLENENTNKDSEIAKNAALAQQEEANSRKRQEEEEARKIVEKEEKEREAREQEAAAAARKAEDEARAARELAEEEERKRKELEQRRARQQEEERQRRAEHERLRIAKLRKELEEQEQRRRDALPNRLRVSANLVGANDPRAKSHTWLKQFMPVVTARTAQLNSSCGPEVADELWVPNFLVAPLLATNDLQLSQYASWEKRQATFTQRLNLWRVTRRILVQGDDLETPCSSFGEVIRRDGETRPKYFGMEHIFWVKLSDFMDLVPHIPHLNGLDLEFLKMHIDQEPSSHVDSSEFPDGPQVNGNGYYTTSDHHEITATVNGLTNGFGHSRPSTYV